MHESQIVAMRNNLQSAYFLEAEKVEKLANALRGLVELWEQKKILPAPRSGRDKIKTQFEQSRTLLSSLMKSGLDVKTYIQ
jgi:hypothetical protein